MKAGRKPDESSQHCLISRAHDLGFRDVMQGTRTFGAVGCSPRGPYGPRNPGTRRERGDDESPEWGQGAPEAPRAHLGAQVPRASRPVRNRLPVPQGREEGPAQAGAAVLLPDAGG